MNSLQKVKSAELEEMKTYLGRTAKSYELFQKASRVTPLGVNSNIRHMQPYPLYIDRGLGSRLWDADGNEYIDYQLGFGALMVGHSPPELVRGVKERLDKGGILYGAEAIEAREVAEELARRFKLDMVRFSNTGSDATFYALRFARAYTGRDKIIKFEGCYNGYQDYLFVSYYPPLAPAKPMQFPQSLGIPEYVWKNTLIARFNDLNSVEDLLRKHGDDVAAIILEPVAMNMGVIPPEKGFLEGLRKLSDEYGAALIFDEVKTGVKLAAGGATEYYNVIPDLTAVAKSIAGGFPLSAIIGKEEIMELIATKKVAHAGTYNANQISITAAHIVLKKLLTPDVYPRAYALSDELAKGYIDVLEDEGIDARVQWIGVNGHIYTGLTEEAKSYVDYLKQDGGMWWRFAYAMMNRGIIPEVLTADDQWTISTQHTKEDVEKTIETFKEVAKTIF